MNTARMYRKKPVVIEAFQNILGVGLLPDWFIDAENQGDVIRNDDNTITIKTLEGDHLCGYGDWVIQGVAGELYPCKPEIFEATYESVSHGRSR